MEVIHEFDQKTAERIQNGYQVRIEAYFSRGFELLRRRLDLFVLFTIVFFIGTSIPVVDIFVVQPLAAGFLIVAFYLAGGKDIIFDNFFEGFRHFAGLFLFTLISGLLIFLGCLALLIPGVYLAVGYIFTPFYIIFAKKDFWDAMESSRKLVHREWLSIFAFVLVLILVNILGALVFGIGLLFTVPLSYCALYAAFDDIIGVSN
jgi:hypothetical protein